MPWPIWHANLSQLPLVFSWLNLFNCLLNGLPAFFILRSILHQSTATRVIFWKHKSDQVIPLLQKKKKKKRIKWLHIPSGIKTKLFTVAYEVLLVWLCLPLWALDILQTYTTSFCFSNMPNSLLPHSFRIWSRWLEHFFIGCLKAVSFSPFRSQLKCHLLRKAFPYHLFKAILTSPQPYSVTLSSLIVWIEFNTVMKVSHLSIFAKGK